MDCYDTSCNVVAADYSTYNGSTFNTYYYFRNAQNDIVKLVDNSVNTVVEYTYDSWSKLLSTSGSLASTLGKDNPFRYRGYVYDEETGWYYLQSRYYNPEVGRFISPDVYLSTGQGVLGHNAYAYCLNNPINRFDESGHAAILTKDDYWQNVAEGGAGTIPLPYPIDIGDSVKSVIGTIIAFIAALMSLSETDVDVDTSTKPNTSTRKPYYGVRIYAGEFQILTPPMDLEGAIAWTVSAMALGKYIDNKKKPTKIGRSTSWGIYAETAVDASAFAVVLGEVLGIVDMSQLVYDKHHGSGTYNHYHMPGRSIIYNGNLYRHFHIWYGELMS